MAMTDVYFAIATFVSLGAVSSAFFMFPTGTVFACASKKSLEETDLAELSILDYGTNRQLGFAQTRKGICERL